MEFAEVLRGRRMVRRYTGETVAPESLDRILHAATRGPSAGGSQGIAVIAVTAPQTIAEVAAACGEGRYVAKGFDPWISTSGALIVLCAEPAVYRARYCEPDKHPASLERVPWWFVDAGASLMAILLTVVDEGLSAGFHGGGGIDGVAALLGIPESVTVVGVVTIGRAAPDRRSGSLARPRRTENVHREAW